MRQRETDNYTLAHADNYVCLNLPCIKENTSMYVMIIDESITLHQARFVLIRPVRTVYVVEAVRATCIYTCRNETSRGVKTNQQN